jgi:hypothetical protein
MGRLARQVKVQAKSITGCFDAHGIEPCGRLRGLPSQRHGAQ